MKHILLFSMPGGGEWIILIIFLGLIIVLLTKFRTLRVILFLGLGILILIGGLVGFNVVNTHESNIVNQLKETFNEREAQEITVAKTLSIAAIGVGLLFIVLGIISAFRRSGREEEVLVQADVNDEDDFVNELEKLHTLLKKGIITQDEFEAEKKKVLGRR